MKYFIQFKYLKEKKISHEAWSNGLQSSYNQMNTTRVSACFREVQLGLKVKVLWRRTLDAAIRSLGSALSIPLRVYGEVLSVSVK